MKTKLIKFLQLVIYYYYRSQNVVLIIQYIIYVIISLNSFVLLPITDTIINIIVKINYSDIDYSNKLIPLDDQYIFCKKKCLIFNFIKHFISFLLYLHYLY